MEGIWNLPGAIVAPIYRDRNTILIVYLHSRLDSSQDTQLHPQLVGLVKSSNGMEKWGFSNAFFFQYKCFLPLVTVKNVPNSLPISHLALFQAAS